MKTVCFIRHAKSTNLYLNYEGFPFEEFCRLAKGELDQSLNPESKAQILEKLKAVSRRYDVIFYSPARRAKETSKIIKENTDNNLKIIENLDLKEIYFDPYFLTSADEFSARGMPAIRESLYNFMMQGKEGVESVSDVYLRIKHLEKNLKDCPYQSILCITHSFFMRVLFHYFLKNKKNPKEISAVMLTKTIDYNYLDGFVFKLD